MGWDKEEEGGERETKRDSTSRGTSFQITRITAPNAFYIFQTGARYVVLLVYCNLAG